LTGGCLSLLTATLGTPFEIQTAGKILFLEDVNAPPYQVDRMLMPETGRQAESSRNCLWTDA
jgi:muramoyltetrapeptide carboxypeptidase LdcA involved in peptidoglycan recycling